MELSTRTTGKPSASLGRRRAVLVGIIGSALTLPVHVLVSPTLSVQLAAANLACIGAIYIGFAVMEQRLNAIIGEGAVGMAFLVFAVSGLSGLVWMIPIGYVLHGFWDLFHHAADPPRTLARPPRWYPTFCVTIDLLIAGGLVLIWLR